MKNIDVIESLSRQMSDLARELEATRKPPTPEMAKRLEALVTTMRAEVATAKSGLEADCMAQAAELRKKAAELLKPKPPEPPPEPKVVPFPWEDHQGVGEARVSPLVRELVEMARSSQARP